MYLTVALKNGIDAPKFVNEVIETIKSNAKGSNPEFKTWKVKTLQHKITKESYEVLVQDKTQLEEIGCLRMIPNPHQTVRVNFHPRVNQSPEDGQIAMYLCRCATMLRNHFPEAIDSMGIFDL